MQTPYSKILTPLHPGDGVIIAPEAGFSPIKYYTKIKRIEEYSFTFEIIKTQTQKRVFIESDHADIYTAMWEPVCKGAKVGIFDWRFSTDQIAYIYSSSALPERSSALDSFLLNHHCMVQPEYRDARQMSIMSKPARLLYVSEDHFILATYDTYERDFKISVQYSDIEFRGVITDIAYGDTGKKLYYCTLSVKTDDYMDLYLWIKAGKKT